MKQLKMPGLECKLREQSHESGGVQSIGQRTLPEKESETFAQLASNKETNIAVEKTNL